MAQKGELAKLVRVFADDLETPPDLTDTVDEKVQGLQDIASTLDEERP